MAEWDRLQLARPDPPPPAVPTPPPEAAELSEKEIARQYAMRYAYVEGELGELYEEGKPGGKAGDAEAKKLAEEKRLQVLQALKLDGKKKKHKKQQEGAYLHSPG